LYLGLLSAIAAAKLAMQTRDIPTPSNSTYQKLFERPVL
jgi:hypothetical protein